MKIAILATVLCGCWWTAEFIRSSHQDKTLSRDRDSGSSKLWDVAHLVGVIGVIVGFTDVGHVRHGEQLIRMSGFGLMVSGISVRWLAMHTLGKYFAGQVRIFEDHRLIRTGLYQHVRHPAYAGDLIAYLGFGLVFSNWISLVLIFCSILFAALYRMRIEEQVLREAFRQEYLDYLICDRDQKFGFEVIAAVKATRIIPKRTSFRSPWQNGLAERWVGSCRRDLLDHIVALNERHLKRLLSEYVRYHHEDRTHLGLEKGTPDGRIRSVASGQVLAQERLGGLHHRYDRAA